MGPPPDRFLVGLGVLGLLSAAGQTAPVLCTIDDAHLLDPESLDALAFVARRVEAEYVALVFAARDEEHIAVQLAGILTLRLAGLSIESAVQVLNGALPDALDQAVAVQIAVATGGNPSPSPTWPASSPSSSSPSRASVTNPSRWGGTWRRSTPGRCGACPRTSRRGSSSWPPTRPEAST